MSQRLLLYFSYIGTNYNGMQRMLPRGSSSPCLSTVQGIIEFGLSKVLRVNGATISISSRTDGGVHAISSCAHFDYTCPDNDPLNTMSPEKLCESLNFFFEKNKTEIRMKRIVQVDKDFHCRGAKSRVYCYRLAVARPNVRFTCPDSSISRTALLPITQIHRVQCVPQPFDVGAIFDACKIFLGQKNFRSFSKIPEGKKAKDEMEEKDYYKTITRVSITRVNLENTSRLGFGSLDEDSAKFDYYDFTFQGSGFLRRQVRKMVGTLLGIANGKIGLQDIQHMFDYPHERNWNPKCSSATSDGLYLKCVDYTNPPIVRGFLS